MAVRAWNLKSSDRFYGALLWLYPASFRARFGGEMMQIFRDCRQDEAGVGSPGAHFAFWLRSFSDLALSLSAVWQREILRITQIDFAVGELADSLAVPMIVVATLLVAGHTWAILTRSVTAPAKMPASHGLWNLEPLVTAGFVAVALGALGVLTALVVARCNRIERPWIKL